MNIVSQSSNLVFGHEWLETKDFECVEVLDNLQEKMYPIFQNNFLP